MILILIIIFLLIIVFFLSTLHTIKTTWGGKKKKYRRKKKKARPKKKKTRRGKKNKSSIGSIGSIGSEILPNNNQFKENQFKDELIKLGLSELSELYSNLNLDIRNKILLGSTNLDDFIDQILKFNQYDTQIDDTKYGDTNFDNVVNYNNWLNDNGYYYLLPIVDNNLMVSLNLNKNILPEENMNTFKKYIYNYINNYINDTAYAVDTTTNDNVEELIRQNYIIYAEKKDNENKKNEEKYEKYKKYYEDKNSKKIEIFSNNLIKQYDLIKNDHKNIIEEYTNLLLIDLPDEQINLIINDTIQNYISKNNNTIIEEYQIDTNKTNIIIIGAGPIGLYTAYKILFNANANKNDKKYHIYLINDRGSYKREQVLLVENVHYILPSVKNNNLSSTTENVYNSIFGSLFPPRSNFNVCINKSFLSLPMSSVTTSDLENGIMDTLENGLYDNNRQKYSDSITFIMPGKGEFHELDINNDRIGINIDSNDNQYNSIIISTNKKNKKKIPLKNIDHIFSCSGGNDPFYYDGLKNSKFEIITPDKKKYNNPQSVPITNYGIAVILKLKDGADYIELLNTHVCNNLSMDRQKTKMAFDNYLFNSNLINQDKYRIFIQPGCDAAKFGGKDARCYIYLGIQIKDGEWHINENPNNINLYIIHVIIFACLTHNIEKYFDLSFDESKFSDLSDKLFSNLSNEEFSKLIQNFESNLPFVHKIDIFPIKIYGISKSSIEWQNCNGIKYCDILGDGAIHVNFFSGSGFNFGIKIADLVIDNLHNGINNSNPLYKDPLNETRKSRIPNHDYSLTSTLTLSNRVSLHYNILKLENTSISANIIEEISKKKYI